MRGKWMSELGLGLGSGFFFFFFWEDVNYTNGEGDFSILSFNPYLF